MVDTATLTGLILAGGRARRMGGRDKGLIRVAGRPLVEHVLSALRPQVATILISANRNLTRYRRYGAPVLPDSRPGFVGPLGGIAAGLAAAHTPFLLCVPCDAPLMPGDLAARLGAAALCAGRRAAVVHDGVRRQPLFVWLACELRADLEHWLECGGTKAADWLARHDPVEVDFSDCAGAFRNVNDPAELAAVASMLARRCAPRP